MIFSEPRGDAAKRLVKLQSQEREAKAQARELTVQRRAAHEDVARLEEELTEAYARGREDKKVAEKLARARETASQPWEQRSAGAERALQRAAGEVERHITASLVELAAELAPDCFAAAERVEKAIEEVFAAREAWQAEARRFTDLLRPVQGVSGADLPYLKLERLEGALRGLRGQVPPPMPRQLLAELGARSSAEPR